MANTFNRHLPIAAPIAPPLKILTQDLLLAHTIQHANVCRSQKAVAIRITSQ